jgi:hypothetical protein
LVVFSMLTGNNCSRRRDGREPEKKRSTTVDRRCQNSGRLLKVFHLIHNQHDLRIANPTG